MQEPVIYETQLKSINYFVVWIPGKQGYEILLSNGSVFVKVHLTLDTKRLSFNEIGRQVVESKNCGWH